MSTLRERAEKAEARIKNAETCLFEMAVEYTILARENAAQYGPSDSMTRGYEKQVDAYVGGLYFLLPDGARFAEDAHGKIRAQVEKAADDRIAAKDAAAAK